IALPTYQEISVILVYGTKHNPVFMSQTWQTDNSEQFPCSYKFRILFMFFPVKSKNKLIVHSHLEGQNVGISCFLSQDSHLLLH
uniref:Uncharacterized protein n=1 Tax=Zonotrichia albicollis TaxID=44394 RepID=A0A8D2NCG4_ZONAL